MEARTAPQKFSTPTAAVKNSYSHGVLAATWAGVAVLAAAIVAKYAVTKLRIHDVDYEACAGAVRHYSSSSLSLPLVTVQA